MKSSLIAFVVLFISFQSVNGQNKILFAEMQNYFDELILNSDPKLDCGVFQKLIENTFQLTFKKFSKEIETRVKSKTDLSTLSTELLNHFLSNFPKIALRLSECTSIPKHANHFYYFPDEIIRNGFAITITRFIFNLNPSFYKSLPNIVQSVVDSLNQLYNNWSPNKIIFSLFLTAFLILSAVLSKFLIGIDLRININLKL